MSPIALVVCFVVAAISLPFLGLLACAATPLVEAAVDAARSDGR
jgi:hypothetical protein